ncbi:MAG TPA: M23 family metallopeptidase [Actinomycetota bacterium]|jgi:murein DD-endopeptidase MepM/ murein hydrolase activator NlpD|nr:M23 family metallopeptidase [Actinomycetota bacterium]
MARSWRFVAPIVMAAVLLTLSVGSAIAVTRVRHALLERHQTVEQSRAVRRQENRLKSDLRRQIATFQRTSQRPHGPGARSEDVRVPATNAAIDRLLVFARSRLRRLDPWARHRLAALHTRYRSLQSWLDHEGIFRTCPVPSFTTIYNNFGMIVRLPHVPVHVHQGDDVMAPTGSPILAPFDGYATSGRSKLGGLEVRVFGVDGYVYNAHLSRLGSLGYVTAGDIVGYVGSTGDATGPHDHIEWHPGDGVAVDPNPLLTAACVDALSGS